MNLVFWFHIPQQDIFIELESMKNEHLETIQIEEALIAVKKGFKTECQSFKDNFEQRIAKMKSDTSMKIMLLKKRVSTLEKRKDNDELWEFLEEMESFKCQSCGETITLEDIDSHDCPFNSVIPCDLCLNLIHKDNYLEHTKICDKDLDLIPCAFCDAKEKPEKYLEHEKFCKRSPTFHIICDKCGQSFIHSMPHTFPFHQPFDFF